MNIRLLRHLFELNLVQLRRGLGLLILSVMLIGCLGQQSSVQVIYVSPEPATAYTTSNFSPEIAFPDGIPDQSDVEVQINGVVVTSEFDLWDNGGDDKARISGQVDNGSYPIMFAALLEGTNIIQVTKPQKEIIYFTMDMSGAEVHITDVIDNYCGTVFINSVGSNSDMGDGKITRFDCSRYAYRKCAHPSNLDLSVGPQCGQSAGYTCIGNPVYKSILGAQCDDLNNGTSTTAAHSANRPSARKVYVRGYFENESQLVSMNFRRYSVNTSGGRSQQSSTTVGHGNSWASNGNYVHFGASGVSCNGDVVNLNTNEFCILHNDADNMQIGGTDVSGFGYTEWMRPIIGMKDSRLSNGGVLGVRIEDTTIQSFLSAVGDTLATGQSLITGGGPPTYIINPNDAPPGICVGCQTMSMDIKSLILNKADLTNPNMPATSGRFEMFLDLNDTSGGYGVDISGDINSTCYSLGNAISQCQSGCSGWTSVFCKAACVVSETAKWGVCNTFISGINGGYGIKLDADSGIRADLSVTGGYKVAANTQLTNPNFNIKSGMDITLGGGGFISGFVNFLEPIIRPIVNLFISNILSGMVTSLVETLFNKDLPLMRLVIPGVNADGNAIKQFMALSPEVDSLTTSQNAYDSNRALELELGLHTSGKPRLNRSLGTIYDSNNLPNLYQVTTAKDNNIANKRTLGIVVNESFVNQLFVGLWESGILYIDFNAGNNPLINSFINNAQIKFASASPWQVDLLSAGEDTKGNLQIDVNDLVVHFSGDVFDPFRGVWYYDKVFFTLEIELDVYVSLAASDQDISLSFDSIPTARLVGFASDYIPVNEALGQNLLNQVMPTLFSEMEALKISLPEIAGVNLAIGDVWMPNSTNLGITIDGSYNP